MRIFIVEDDPIIAKALKRALETWQYETKICDDFQNVISDFIEFDPHLLILDLVLPYFNGYHWCSEVRKISEIPIVLISSKSENMDIIMAMQIGGDDYITKPFDLDVVIAKVQALMRRSYSLNKNHDALIWGNINLTPGEAKLIYLDKQLDLTKTELQIMDALFRAQGSFVSRDALMERCWAGDSYIDDNTLAVNITRLRKKLVEIGLDNLIQTKKGVGYALQVQ